MNAWMEEAGVKGRGEVIYSEGETGTGWPDLTLIQSTFFWHTSSCTA